MSLVANKRSPVLKKTQGINFASSKVSRRSTAPPPHEEAGYLVRLSRLCRRMVKALHLKNSADLLPAARA